MDDAKKVEQGFNDDANDESHHAFKSKLNQLQEIESKIHAELDTDCLTQIQPGSTYDSSFVAKFRRRWFNPCRVGIAVQYEYDVTGSTGQQLDIREAHDIQVINPKSNVLLLIAVVSSAAGVALKQSIEDQANAEKSGAAGKPAETPGVAANGTSIGVADKAPFHQRLGEKLVDAPGIGAAILAIAIFVVFDRTDFSKKLGPVLDWRIAVVIGIIAGLFGDRVLAAFRAILGCSARARMPGALYACRDMLIAEFNSVTSSYGAASPVDYSSNSAASVVIPTYCGDRRGTDS